MKRAAPTPSKPTARPEPVNVDLSPTASLLEQLTQASNESRNSNDQLSTSVNNPSANTSNEPTVLQTLQPKTTKNKKKKNQQSTNSTNSLNHLHINHILPIPVFPQQYAPAPRVPIHKNHYMQQAPRVPLYNPFIPSPAPFQFYQPTYGTNFRRFAVQHLEAQTCHIFDENGKRMNIDKLIAKDPGTWKQSLSNELGRLAFLTVLPSLCVMLPKRK